MNQERKCRTHTLAAQDGFLVERCSCGGVHLNIGSLTLRMTVEASELFATVLAKAMVINRTQQKHADARKLRLVEDEHREPATQETGTEA